MALYFSAPTKDAQGVLDMAGARRFDIVTLHDLTAQQFTDALAEGLQKNLSEMALASVQARVDRFTETLLSIENANEGTRILIDFIPHAGTRLTIGGKRANASIEGADFFMPCCESGLVKTPRKAISNGNCWADSAIACDTWRVLNAAAA